MKKVMFLILAGSLIGSAGINVVHATTNKPINWVLPAELVTVDSSEAKDVLCSQIISQIGQGLYRYDAKGRPQLADAKTVKVAKDGLTWTFTLKNGLAWEDGSAVTASDYVYAWRRTLDPKNSPTIDNNIFNIGNAEKIHQGTLTDLTKLGIEAPNAKTFIVHLASPTPMLPSIITATGFYAQHASLIKQLGAKYGTAAEYTSSNGPYILKDWNGSSTSFKLVKNPHYVDAKKVKTNRINFQVIVDSNTAYNLYKSGKVDYVKLDADQVKKERTNPAYQKIRTAQNKYLTIAQRNPTLKNVNLHRAFQYAINKKVLANKILLGSAIPSTTFTPRGLNTNVSDGKDFSQVAKTKYTDYSPTKAKAAWKKAQQQLGIKRLTLQLIVDSDDINRKVGQYIQAQLQDTLPGLTIEVKAQPKAARVEKMLAHNYDLIVGGWTGTTTDPSSFLGALQTGEAENVAGWSNPTFDHYLQAAKTTDMLKPKQRMLDFIKADELLQKEAPVITLYYETTPALIRQSIKGLQINQTGATFDFTKAIKK